MDHIIWSISYSLNDIDYLVHMVWLICGLIRVNGSGIPVAMTLLYINPLMRSECVFMWFQINQNYSNSLFWLTDSKSFSFKYNFRLYLFELFFKCPILLIIRISTRWCSIASWWCTTSTIWWCTWWRSITWWSTFGWIETWILTILHMKSFLGLGCNCLNRSLKYCLRDKTR